MESKDLPNPLVRASNLLVASAKWRGAGKPMRTEDEVKLIYESKCLPCPKAVELSPGASERYCVSCGCRVSTTVDDWNKIALATESCPLNLW